MRFLKSWGLLQLEQCLQDCMSWCDENDEADVSHQLSQVFHAVGQGSSVEEYLDVVSGILDSLTNPYWLNQFLAITFDSIRSSNYPSGFNSAALSAKQDYIDEFGSRCQSCTEHTTTRNPLTIDHVIPVAEHWNAIGRKNGKSVRSEWYNDPDNHEYLCRSCNSKKGSGGVFYILSTQAGYSH